MYDSVLTTLANVNAALATTAVVAARRIQETIESETRDLGIGVGIYPSAFDDVDFVIILESEDDSINEVVECLINTSPRRWLTEVRQHVASHRAKLASRSTASVFRPGDLFSNPN